VVFTPGRWHNQGIPVVYCGDHPGSALLEILVHVDLSDIPTSFQLLEIHCPDDVMVAAPHVNQSQLDDLAWTRETGSRPEAAAPSPRPCRVQVHLLATSGSSPSNFSGSGRRKPKNETAQIWP
jgi:RES domain-containing protein